MSFKDYLFRVPTPATKQKSGFAELTDVMPAAAIWAVAERLEALVEVQEARLAESGKDFKAMMRGIEAAGLSGTEEDTPTGGVNGSDLCIAKTGVEGKAYSCLLLMNHGGDCIFDFDVES